MEGDGSDVWLAWGRKAGLRLLDAFASSVDEEDGGELEVEQGGRIKIGGESFVVDGLILKRDTSNACDP